jgi:hypothetical protein
VAPLAKQRLSGIGAKVECAAAGTAMAVMRKSDFSGGSRRSG